MAGEQCAVGGIADDDCDRHAGAVDRAGVDHGDLDSASVAGDGDGDDGEVGAVDAAGALLRFLPRRFVPGELGSGAGGGLDDVQVDAVVEALAGGGEGDDFELVPAVAGEQALDVADGIGELAAGREGAGALPDLLGAAEVAEVVNGGDVDVDDRERAGAARADFEVDPVALGVGDAGLVVGREDAGVGRGRAVDCGIGLVLGLLRGIGRRGAEVGGGLNHGDGEFARGDAAGGGDCADLDVGRAEHGGGPLERGGVDALVVERGFGRGRFGAVDEDREAGHGLVALGGGAQADRLAQVDVLERFDADDRETQGGGDPRRVVGDVDPDQVLGADVAVVAEHDAEVGAAEFIGGPGEAGDVEAAGVGVVGRFDGDRSAVDEELGAGDGIAAAGLDAELDLLVEQHAFAVAERGGDDGGGGRRAVFVDVVDEGPGEVADAGEHAGDQERDEGGQDDGAAGVRARAGCGWVGGKPVSQGPALLHRRPAASCARSRPGSRRSR